MLRSSFLFECVHCTYIDLLFCPACHDRRGDEGEGGRQDQDQGGVRVHPHDRIALNWSVIIFFYIHFIFL